MDGDARDGTTYLFKPVGDFSTATPTAGSDDDKVLNDTRWVLTEVRNTQASQAVVTYDYAVQDASKGYAHRPSDVTYGPYRVELRFLVSSTNYYYATGTSLLGDQYRHLSSIKITENGNKIRAYDLRYVQSPLTDQKLLTSVQEFGSDYTAGSGQITGGTSLPATTFSYSADTLTFLDQVYPGLGSRGFRHGYRRCRS